MNKQPGFSFSKQLFDTGMNMTDILIRVASGKRLSLEKIPDDKPQECEGMTDLMQQCWNQDRSQRPAFSGNKASDRTYGLRMV